ncbi:MAG: hypothetical protein M3O30_02635 [Planctomycetota bacterium]|nr:hypothetical protein [Planctomycetota bacterium]
MSPDQRLETTEAEPLPPWPQPPLQLNYVTPVSTGQKVWAGAVILLGGLGLILLGGCFLIGVMVEIEPGIVGHTAAAPRSTAAVVLLGVLYLLAFLSFAGAALMILLGLKHLFRVLRN